jgi:hypothetical protein
MCIFCVDGDDTPFHLRKSTAFPRKFVAETVPAPATDPPEPSDKSRAAGKPAPADPPPRGGRTER